MPRTFLALMLVFLTSCSGWTPQNAGHKLAEGAGDYLDTPEGQAKVERIASRGASAAVTTAKAEIKAELKSEWQGQLDQAKVAAANGTATWWQYLIIVAGGGGGTATLWSIVDRLLHGKKHRPVPDKRTPLT